MALVKTLKKGQCAVNLQDIDANHMSLTFGWNADRSAIVLSLGFELDPSIVVTREGDLPDGSYGVFTMGEDKCMAVSIPTLALWADDNYVVFLKSDNFSMVTGGDKGEHGHSTMLAKKPRSGGGKTEHGSPLVFASAKTPKEGGKGEHGNPILADAERERNSGGGGGEGGKGEHGVGDRP